MPCGPLQSYGDCCTGFRKLGSRSFFHVLLQSGNGSSDAWIWLNFFLHWERNLPEQILKTGANPGGCYGTCHDVSGKRAVRFGSRSGEKVAAEADNVQNDDQTDVAVEKDGVQYVSSTLRSGWYPDITVKAGEPVKWEINVPEGSINGCNYRMILQDFGMDHTFENGENVIEFIPEKEGVYTYSCWMGMITGTIYVTGK